MGNKIIYKRGDFLKGPEIYKLHGCNAQGIMGSGAAKCVKELFPEAYVQYNNKWATRGLDLGEVVIVHTKHKTILNCITQEFYGRDSSIIYVSYKAVENALVAVNKYIAENEFSVLKSERCVAMPRIGCGFANGDWEIVSNIIENCAVDFIPVVYSFD